MCKAGECFISGKKLFFAERTSNLRLCGLDDCLLVLVFVKTIQDLMFQHNSPTVKPNIQVFRAHFSEITPNSIRRSCETLTEPNINISDAVDVRQELDLRIGKHFLLI